MLGTTVKDLLRKDAYTSSMELGLPRAASPLHDRGSQRLFVLDGDWKPVGVTPGETWCVPSPPIRGVDVDQLALRMAMATGLIIRNSTKSPKLSSATGLPSML